jgi:hypothetical protein
VALYKSVLGKRVGKDGKGVNVHGVVAIVMMLVSLGC